MSEVAAFASFVLINAFLCLQPFIDLRTGELKAEVSNHFLLVMGTKNSATRQMQLLVM